jgi:hypothetical protein
MEYAGYKVNTKEFTSVSEVSYPGIPYVGLNLIPAYLWNLQVSSTVTKTV